MKPENVHKITVASPCSVPWDTMKGDDFIRHCGQCKMNVYNLSAMSLDEVASFLEKKEGRLCVRFFRREDGTILTQDCPVGLAAVRRRLMMLAGVLATAMVAAIQWVGPDKTIRFLRSTPLARLPGVTTVLDFLQAKSDPVALPGIVPQKCEWTAGEPVLRTPVRLSPVKPAPVYLETKGDVIPASQVRPQALVEHAGGIGPLPMDPPAKKR